MLIKLDLHLHSCHSYDSNSSVLKIIKIAKRRGLSGICIADHNNLGGSLEAQRLNQDPNFLIIPGQETVTEIGEILGLFIKKNLMSRNFEDLVKEIKAQSGLVVLPHPAYRTNSLSIIKKYLPQIDIIEVFNARSKKSENEIAKKLAIQYKKPVISVSDAHGYFEIGQGQTILNCQTLDLEEVKKNLLNLNNQLECGYTPYYISHGLWLITEKIKSLKK